MGRFRRSDRVLCSKPFIAEFTDSRFNVERGKVYISIRAEWSGEQIDVEFFEVVGEYSPTAENDPVGSIASEMEAEYDVPIQRNDIVYAFDRIGVRGKGAAKSLWCKYGCVARPSKAGRQSA